VSWPLLFIFGVLLRFAGVTPRVRRTFPGEPGSGVESEHFARSGDFSIVVAEFTAVSIQLIRRSLKISGRSCPPETHEPTNPGKRRRWRGCG